jgi:serralysin
MKRRLLTLILLLLIAVSSHAQKLFTITSSKENISCNSGCVVMDIPDLNNNPAAIIWVTPVIDDGLNLNPHPIGVYFFNNQWRIFNWDHKTMPPGARFTVDYVTRPDVNHFRYVVTNDLLQSNGSSVIDHPTLNNNPKVQFNYFLSWNPSEQPGLNNRNDVRVDYNGASGKWYISNINKKYLNRGDAYNIIISTSANTVKETIRVTTEIVQQDPRTMTKTGELVPVISGSLDNLDIIPKTAVPPVYDFSHVRICIDKIMNNTLPAKTIVPTPPVIPKIKSNGELEQVSTVTQPLSGVTNLMWAPGESITVGFYSEQNFVVTNKIKKYVKEWETYANIKFVFINDVSLAKIKVGFERDGTSWSWVGRNVLVNSSDKKTMNLGWLDDLTNETEVRRIVLHEFGHALGFIHEHQASQSDIPWDKEKVYSFFGGDPNNWARSTVDLNVFAKYSQESTNSSAYDRLSIMHYFFPPELTTDGSAFSWNTTLSATDMSFARQVYPFPPAPPTSTGVLKTGDDCDEIEFTVEYNVVHSSEVEFILQPGYDHHNALVNWWKMIGITQMTGTVSALELNKTIKMPANTINKNKPITFAKAKILGAHTMLGYTWNPWPAIVGGCRVKFVWRRDSCN